MSWTEVNMREGLPDGGMPHETILWRMEETDPELVRAASARRAGGIADNRSNGRPYGPDDVDGVGPDEYDDYTRAEIIDWTPDAPYLESDHQRRDPSLSRSQLNVRFNGNRGAYDYLPQHSEMFIGFTGNDPRGATNDPLMNQMRGQMDARAETLTVRMGDNDDNQLAERPWTNQSISYGMKELHRRTKRNAKLFSVTLEGRPWSRNIAADDLRYGRNAGAARAGGAQDGAEGLPDARGEGPNTDSARFRGGDSGATHAEAVGRTADGGVGAGASTAGPWRHTGGMTAMSAGRAGQQRAAGRGVVERTGGALALPGAADAAWATAETARAANRQTLAASAALAARHGRAVRLGRPDQAGAESFTSRGTSNGVVAADAAVARRGTGGDSATADSAHSRLAGRSGDFAADTRRAAYATDAARKGAAAADAERGSRGRGAAPSAPNAGARVGGGAGTSSAPVENAHLINAVAIVAGLREGTAAGRRRIANRVVLDGVRTGERADAALGRGVTPAADPRAAAARTVGGPGFVAAAARGLATHVYRGAAPVQRRDVAVGGGTYDGAALHASRETVLVSNKLPEWRGGTETGAAVDTEFAPLGPGEVAAGSAVVGKMSLRAGASGAEPLSEETIGRGLNDA